MGPGGPHGLQLRWRASFGVRGGFDSLALPPAGTPIAIDFIPVGAFGQFRASSTLLVSSGNFSLQITPTL